MLKNELLIFFENKEFFSGETVTGYVELRLPSQSLDINDVTLTALGREYSSDSGSEMNTFFREQFILEGPGSKDYGKKFLFVGGKKKVATSVSKGYHRYPFKFTLENVLPCQHTSQYGRVEYSIMAEVDTAKNMGKIANLISTAALKVGGTLFDMNYVGNNSSATQHIEKRTFLLTKGEVSISLGLESKVFLAGSSIKAKFDIDNSTSKTISNAKVELIQDVKIFQYGKLFKQTKNSLGTQTIGTIVGGQKKNIPFIVNIPEQASETIEKRDITIGTTLVSAKKAGKVVRIKYYFDFTSSVTLGKDILFKLPIIIIRRAKEKKLNTKPVLNQLDIIQDVNTTTNTGGSGGGGLYDFNTISTTTTTNGGGNMNYNQINYGQQQQLQNQQQSNYNPNYNQQQQQQQVNYGQNINYNQQNQQQQKVNYNQNYNPNFGNNQQQQQQQQQQPQYDNKPYGQSFDNKPFGQSGSKKTTKLPPKPSEEVILKQLSDSMNY